MTTWRDAHHAGRLGLPVAARSRHPARAAEPRHRSERQRQVEPVSRAASARRNGAGPRHPVARARRRAAVDAVGGTRDRSRARCCRGEHPVQGHVRDRTGQPASGLRRRRLQLRDRSGPPATSERAFGHDPEIKRECIWSGHTLRPSAMLVDRRGPLVKTREARRDWTIVTHRLASFDSMMTHCADPRNTPEMLMLREEMRAWRFYDHFRTDATAPARLPQVGTHTPVLSHDGADLAAALQTIRQIGDTDALDQAIDDAFPGARVAVTDGNGWFEVEMQQHGLLRPLKAGRTLRRHAAISAVGRRAADAAAAGAARPERAGNEPPSGSAAGARAPHRADRRAIAGPGRLSCPGAHRCTAATARVPLDHAGKEVRGNNSVRPGPTRDAMAMARAMSRKTYKK